MKNILKLTFLSLALMAASVCANALSFSDVLFSGSYGFGSCAAVCVVDFGTKSYAFEYKFDGTKTGADMLKDLNSPNTGLAVNYTNYTSKDIFVNDFSFDNQFKRNTTGVYPGWNYYNSTDGINWVSSSVGCGDRTLQDGSWDAWNYTGYDSETWAPTAPNPVTPTVPEPSAMISMCSLIGLAAAAKKIRFGCK